MARLEQRLKALGYEIDEQALPPRADDGEAAWGGAIGVGRRGPSAFDSLRTVAGGAT